MYRIFGFVLFTQEGQINLISTRYAQTNGDSNFWHNFKDGCYDRWRRFKHLFIATIIFKNEEAMDKGFCHLQRVKIQVLLECKLNYPSTVTIALAKNESDTSGNYILQCFGIPGIPMFCPEYDDARGAYNECNDILEIEFIFNYTQHVDHYLRITTECDSNSIALKPCRFTANVDFYNSHSINVTCQNPTYLYSSSPIIIQSNKGIYGCCLQHICFGHTCKNLPDGIQCVLQYDPDEILQCQLDGTILNITTPSSESTQTSPENSSKPQNIKTTESPKTSTKTPSINSTSPERLTSPIDITTSTSTEITENEQDIHKTSEGSTDTTTNLQNVKPLELSSKPCDQCDKSPLYVFISLFCLSLLFNIIFIIWCISRSLRN